MTSETNCPFCGQRLQFETEIAELNVNCANCGRDFTTKLTTVGTAKAVESESWIKTALKSLLKSVGRIALVFLIIGVTLAIIISIIPKEPDKPETEADHAYYAAKKFCERYAPSGKNFTTERGQDYLDGKAEWTTNNGHSSWYACGYVDCQNKFGAMRHQFWGAHVILQNGKWHLKYLAIGEEAFINEYE